MAEINKMNNTEQKAMETQANNDVSVRLVDAKELRRMLYDGRSYDERGSMSERNEGSYVFKNFAYFRPNHLDEFDNPYFLIAQDSNEPELNGIVGLVKMNVYDYCGTLPEYWATNYIDVRKDRREEGIAKRLISELNNQLTDQDILVGTPESRLGKQAGIHKMKRELIDVCPVFDDRKDFCEYCNGLNLEENVRVA